MINSKVYGFCGEERILCHSCAERLYGDSLDMYLTAGDIQGFIQKDRPTYASKGLLCDECLSWIFQPDRTENPWWFVDPDPEKHIRLLAPFAGFLETLKIDAMNLRNIVASS